MTFLDVFEVPENDKAIKKIVSVCLCVYLCVFLCVCQSVCEHDIFTRRRSRELVLVGSKLNVGK
jgi:hypothetical protein